MARSEYINSGKPGKHYEARFSAWQDALRRLSMASCLPKNPHNDIYEIGAFDRHHRYRITPGIGVWSVIHFKDAIRDDFFAEASILALNNSNNVWSKEPLQIFPSFVYLLALIIEISWFPSRPGVLISRWSGTSLVGGFRVP